MKKKEGGGCYWRKLEIPSGHTPAKQSQKILWSQMLFNISKYAKFCYIIGTNELVLGGKTFSLKEDELDPKLFLLNIACNNRKTNTKICKITTTLKNLF